MSDPVLDIVIQLWLAEIERRDPADWIPPRYRADLLTSFVKKVPESEGQLERLVSEFDDVSRVLIARGLFEMVVNVGLEEDLLAALKILDIAKKVIDVTFLGDLIGARLDAHRLFLISWIAHRSGMPRFQTYGVAAGRYAEADPGAVLPALVDWMIGLVGLDLGDADGQRTGLRVADRFDECREALRTAGCTEVADDLESARLHAMREATMAEALLSDPEAELSVRSGRIEVTTRISTIVQIRTLEGAENPALIEQAIRWAFLLNEIHSVLGDESSDIKYIEGRLYESSNWKALDALLAAELDRTPDDVEILERQLSSFRQQHRDDDQVKVLEALIRRLPHRAHLFSELGYNYLRLGRHAEGRWCVERALQIDPNDPFAQVIIGRLADTAPVQVRLDGDRMEFTGEDRAVAEPNGLIRASFADSDMPGAVLLGGGRRTDRSPGQDDLDRAESHFAHNDFIEAEVDYRAAIAADPNLLMAYVGMGDVHYAAGRYNTAAAYFEEACEIASFAPAYRFLGDCLIRLGDRAGAIVCYRKALIIDPDYGMARAGLAALLKRQRESEAMQSVTAVRPAIAEPTGAAQLDERLAALTRRERVRPDLSTIVDGVVERAPIIAEILAASSLTEQEDLVRTNLESAQYPALFQLLQVLEFFYVRLEGRTRDSLRISQLRLRIIQMLPESWQPHEVDDANRAGLFAEAYLSMSRAHLRVGEPQQALADALSADAWILQSEEERERDGITFRPRLERIFGLTGSRRAEIQETIARIHSVLGDEGGRPERDTSDVTTDEERNSDRDVDPEQWHAAIEELLADEQFSLDRELRSQNNEVTTMGVAHALVSVARVLNHLSLHRSALSYMYKTLELNVHQGAVDRACYDNILIGKILLKRRDLGDAAAAFETALKLASAQQVDGGEFGWTDSDGTDWRVYDGEPALEAAAALADELATHGRRDEAHQFIQLSLALREAVRATIATESYRINYQTHHVTAYQVAVGLYVGMAVEAPDPESLIRRAFQEVERARGRAFLDVMGTTSLPPPEGVPEALLERERDYLTRLEEWRLSESIDLAEYEQLRSDLKATWRAMSTYPAAGSYLALREGRPVLFAELSALLTTD